jgi:hypothetical protein
MVAVEGGEDLGHPDAGSVLKEDSTSRARNGSR